MAEYKPGTYKASAIGKQGKEQTGQIEVEVTLSKEKIDDIKIVSYDQSVDHKKYGEIVTQAKDKIPADILARQSVDVDAVAKATMATNAIQLAVAKVLHENTVAYQPGTYTGTAKGRSDKKHDGTITVEVTVSENRIESINVVEYHQSTDNKKYGAAITEAKEKVPAGIVGANSLDVDVDVVTSATFASNALELAVARALAQAR